jgi:C-8 sterol isomerase
MRQLFDPAQLHAAAQTAVGLPHQDMVRTVAAELDRRYPGHIEQTEDWVMSLAGGATGIMTVLHCSLSEYLLIFGTPIGTEGFSGRYHIDIYDYLLAGEMWTYTEEACRERIITRPGDMAFLPRGQTKGFRVAEGSWMLEYGRGPIMTCLPMAVSGAVASLDGRTLWRTVSISTRLTCKSLLRRRA